MSVQTQVVTKMVFFLGSVFQTAVTTQNVDEIKKFQNPEDSQGPEVDAEF